MLLFVLVAPRSGAFVALAKQPAGTAPATLELDPRHQDFVDAFDPLLTVGEREAFASLTTPYSRDAFMRRFFEVRDPFPETQRNEWFDSVAERLAEARDRFEDLSSAQARLLVLHGPPERIERVSCELLRPLEVWYYRASPLIAGEFYAVFERQGKSYSLWRPSDGLAALTLTFAIEREDRELEEISERCVGGDQIVTALVLSPDWKSLEARLAPRGGDEWAAAFLDRLVQRPADGSSWPMEIEYVGQRQSRTIVRARLAAPKSATKLPPSARAESSPLFEPNTPPVDEPNTNGEAELANERFVVDGEVLLGEELFENFRYRFDIPVEGGRPIVPIVLDRFLRPGSYRMNLRVRATDSADAFFAAADLDVPVWRDPRAEPAAASGATTAATTAATSGAITAATSGAITAATTEPSPPADSAPTAGNSGPRLQLLADNQELLMGMTRIQARIEGAEIAKLAFELDSKPVMVRSRGPWVLDVDLGRSPQTHEVRATAFDSAGRVVAADTLILNAGPNRFRVRLTEPRRGQRYDGFLVASAEVDLPPIERLERVEYYLNDGLLATLYQEPYEQPIAVPPGTELAYVRVVAFLESGLSTEDVVFVNAPNDLEYVDVDFVELYVTATDRKGRLAAGLNAEDFVVREDGEPQTIRRFELVRDLPIRACVLLDTSTSMQDRLAEAETAALRFFELVLSEKDLACLVTFNDKHELVVPLTNNREILAGGLAQLSTEGETALYDSVIHTLFYFQGLKGKKALILLSDGEDSRSSLRYEDALEYARRSGVAIYAIGLDISSRDVDIRTRLRRMADETGGDSYFIDSASELLRVYTRIENELRSQYLVAYQSSHSAGDFRRIEIAVTRPGLRARSMKGYYP